MIATRRDEIRLGGTRNWKQRGRELIGGSSYYRGNYIYTNQLPWENNRNIHGLVTKEGWP